MTLLMVNELDHGVHQGYIAFHCRSIFHSVTGQSRGNIPWMRGMCVFRSETPDIRAESWKIGYELQRRVNP